MKKSFSISVKSIYIYIITIGFLFPRGYNSVSEIYHTICSGVMWLSVILTWLQWLKYSKLKSRITKRKITKYTFQISVYFILAIVITLICRKNVSSGLQQLLAAPSVCVFMLLNLKRNPKKILNIVVNILCIEFSINLLLTLVQPEFYGLYHTIFLGHIQVVSQYGVLSILVVTLCWLLYHERKKTLIFLGGVTIYTMVTTDAESAVFTAIGFLIAFVIYKWKMSWILKFHSEFYVLAMVLLSAVIVYFSTSNTSLLSYIDINGRSFVWQSAIEKIKAHPILGYGIDGVLLATFWTDGFNYAHNQLVQNLLDGGLVLTISFWNMINGFVRTVNKIKIEKYKVLCNATLIALLFIMLFESTTLYIYMYMILAILLSVRSITENDRRKTWV